MERKTWTEFYLNIAREAATMSRDPSTQCGAVIVRPNNTPAGFGFNDFARGVRHLPERYEDRDFKLAAIVHAEENAILNSEGSLEYCDLYVTPLTPCAHCASIIVQKGIRRVIAEAPVEIPERWRANMAIARTILEEGGVQLEIVPLRPAIRKRRVIVESPYAGDIEANVAYARAALQDCLLRGEAPIASHLLYTQPGVLDDSVKGERELGLVSGWAWIDRADCVVVYEDHGISQGMHRGINHALDMEIPVVYRRLSGEKSDAA